MVLHSLSVILLAPLSGWRRDPIVHSVHGHFCAPRAIGARSVNKNDSTPPSRQMKHTISVEVAYHCAQHVRDVFHQATPAQGRRPTRHLMKRLPTCPIPEIARLGQTLRTWKDAHLAYLDTAGASNAPHRSHQRNHRTRQTHRQRLPQPHQQPTPNAPHRKRPRRLHPHPTMKSRFTVVPFGQGFRDMSPPSKEFMKLALEQRLHHAGHEVLAWMVDNIHIRQDSAGNIKPDKQKSTEKINGVVATIMALDRAIRNAGVSSESVYDSRGLLLL